MINISRRINTIGELLAISLLLLICVIHTSCGSVESEEKTNDWIDLFNKQDLTGWTPKFSGRPLGENYLSTFNVRDSLLVVTYTQWDSLNDVFGHLFYETPFSSYVVEAEYRFVGAQVPGGPGWAFANNGLMLHCQDPSTISLDQDFPLSLEFQFLGAATVDAVRSTGNLCTPGCHVVIQGQTIEDHCLDGFSGPSIPIGQWVRAQAVVWSDSIVHHVVNGDTVLTYQNPRIGGGLAGLDASLYPEGTLMKSGHIAIQAESHPIEFRSIRLLSLD